MAIIIKLLNAGAITGTTQPTIYSPATPSTTAIIENIRLANTSGATATMQAYLVPSGTATNVRIIEANKSLANNDILVIKPELTLGPGDAVVVSSSANLDFAVSGVERT
jgi:hypothetical protein